MHSWRVLVLPYLGENALYRDYRFDEPWDGPHNSRLAQRMPAVYGCPAQARAPFTNYSVVVGPETAFRGSRPLSRAMMSDYPTVALVVEVKEETIPWMAPRDLTMPECQLTPLSYREKEDQRAAIDSLLQQGLDPGHHPDANLLFGQGLLEKQRLDSGSFVITYYWLTASGGEVVTRCPF
jgi:hypothetical protein